MRKKPRAAREARNFAPIPAQHTLSEIFSQPAAWRETSRQLEQRGMLEQLSKLFFPRSPWLFIACGSSYYLSHGGPPLWARRWQVARSGVPPPGFLFAPQAARAA